MSRWFPAVLALVLCVTHAPASLAVSEPSCTITPGGLSGITYFQGPTGSASLRVGGPPPCNDMIRMSDAATLDGTLTLRFVNGYVPAGGEEFLIVDAGRIVGDFAIVGAEGITGQRFTHRIDHASGNWYFVIIPEPAGLATILVSSAVLIHLRRSRCRRVC